jgi:hypothetical protein
MDPYRYELKRMLSVILLRNCPVCGSQRLISWGKERLARTGEITSLSAAEGQLLLKRLGRDSLTRSLSFCLSCSFLFLNPTYDREELEAIYSYSGPQYAECASEAGVRVDDLWKSRSAKENLEERRKRYAEIILSSRGRRVLDYGGGRGTNLLDQSLSMTAKYVYDFGRAGPCEPGVETLIDLEANFRFDCILHTHVMEHEPDPLRSLNALREIVEPDGFLYLEVPFEYGERLITRKPGAIWHVAYFNRSTVMEIAARTRWRCESVWIADYAYSYFTFSCIAAVLRPAGEVRHIRRKMIQVGWDIFTHLIKRLANRRPHS